MSSAKIALTTVTVTFFLALALLVYLAYMLFWPFNPLTINSVKVPEKVSAKQTLLYDFNYCKNVDLGAVVYRQLVGDNGVIVPFPAVTSVTRPGCHTTKIPLQMVPNTPPGKYYLRGDLVYKMNALRDVHVRYQTPTFEVTP